MTLARPAQALLGVLEAAGADGGQVDVAAAWAVVEQVAPRDQVSRAGRPELGSRVSGAHFGAGED